MVLGADKEKPLIVGIVVERVIKRTSVGRNKPIQIKLDRAEETQEGVKSRTTLRRKTTMITLCQGFRGAKMGHLEAERGVVCGFWSFESHDKP